MHEPRALPPGVAPVLADEAHRLTQDASGAELEALLDRAEAVRRAVHGDEVGRERVDERRRRRLPIVTGGSAPRAP